MKLIASLALVLAGLALAGAAPLTPDVAALLDDSAAARAFDYPALRQGRDHEALAALDQQVSDAIATRAAGRPGSCATPAEVMVRQAVASTVFTSDATAWRTEWAQALGALDRLRATRNLDLTAPPETLPPTNPVVGPRLMARDATDPRIRELFERAGVDQAVRNQFSQVGPLPNTAKQVVLLTIGSQMCALDTDNTAWLKAQVALHGWFTPERVGQQASETAWLLVQHADRDPAFQAEILSFLKTDATPSGRKNYAYLFDRVAVNASRPQSYGTQGRCVGPGRWEPLEVEAPDQLDVRRASVGLPPLAEYKEQFKTLCAS